jgi:hypothetical protein
MDGMKLFASQRPVEKGDKKTSEFFVRMTRKQVVRSCMLQAEKTWNLL